MPICKNCRYFDDRERRGYKGYCTWYKTYEDPDSMARGCTHYEAASGSGTSGCYLTSACVRAKGLPDDCEELTVLRTFRDDYLSKQPDGKEDIAHYYECAPRIVQSIDERADAGSIWDAVYRELICPCVERIQTGHPEEAYQMYKAYSLKLEQQYT